MPNLNAPFIVSIQHYDQTVSVRWDHSDVPLPEVLEALPGLLVAVGFHPDNVRDALGDV